MINILRNKPASLGLMSAFIALSVTFYRGINQTFQNDAQGYVTEARGMLKGWAFMQENPELFGHGFGFTGLILSTLVLTNASSLVLLKIFLAIGHGLSVYLVAKIGEHIGLRKRYWISAAIFFALDPFVLIAATDVQTESITTLLVLWWCHFYIFPRSKKFKDSYMLVMFSLSGVFSVLVKPNTLLPFALLSIAMYLKFRGEGTSKHVFVFPVALFLGVISAYQIFLYKLYSGFVFLSTAGGSNAEFMCRTEFLPQFLGAISASENSRINAIATQSSVASELLLANPTLTIPEINRELTSLGIATCLENPFSSIWVLLAKTFALWRPYTVFGAYGLKVFVLSLLLWFPLTVITVWFLFYKKMSFSGLLLKKYFMMISIAFTLSLLLTPTQIRHRVAFAEPFYWLFLFYFLQVVGRSTLKDIGIRLRKRSSQ